MKAWFTAAGLAAALAATPISAQTPEDWDAGRLHATRAQLEELLQQYERAAGSRGYSEHLRGIADEEAELIRSRLRDGDFQIGDQIVLAVGGQPSLTNTFIVSGTRTLPLPDLDEIPLEGLLRSELRQAIVEHISKYVRNPQVQVQSNIRLAVFGEIGNPGYHVAPSEQLLTDVLMSAGGPTRTAKQKSMRIKRGDVVIWEGETLQRAIVQGRTLDQLSLRAGDEIQIPRGGSWGGVLTVVRSIPWIITGAFAIARLF